MKLGTETASVQNWMMSGPAAIEPKVGMGCTILMWTDRHAATVVEVGTLRGRPMVKIQQDNAARADSNGMSECQDWIYTRDENAPIRTFHKCKHGWREVGGETGLMLGERSKYYDFSF